MAGELADALIARIDKLIAERLDAAVSSRLADADYTAPNNTGIAAIQNKVDAYVDAAVSSRATADDVWAATVRTLTTAPSVIRSIQTGYVDEATNTAATVEDTWYINVTIAPVDISKSVVFAVGVRHDAGSDSTARLLSSTTVRVSKTTSSNAYLHCRWTVLEFV